jgi:acetyl esterase/lipase
MISFSVLHAACMAALAAADATPPSVSAAAVYNATMAGTGIVYGQGLISAGTSQQRAVNLTLDVWLPSQLPGGPAVPASARPAIMFVHGGGFSGSILGKDKAAVITPDVQYFVQRGFVGFQINYRLGEDNASFPQGWPGNGKTGGAELGLLNPIADGGALSESQRFHFLRGVVGGGSLLSLASDPELCVVARAPGGSVSMQPCPAAAAAAATSGGNASTYWWRVGADGSMVGVGGYFDQKCLGTRAPSGDGPTEDKRAFVAAMAFRCDSSAHAQRWRASGLAAPSGGQICHPTSSGEHGEHGDGPPVDSGCLSFSGGFQPPLSHLYPAVRDAKAAVRWLRAEGAVRFQANPDFITLAGGSAGACTILGAGIAQRPGDFTDEIPAAVDPTINSTHPEESAAVRSMIVHWGAPFAVDAATAADPLHRSRYQRTGAGAGAGAPAGTGARWVPATAVSPSVAAVADEPPLPSIIAFNGLIDTTIPIEHILEVQRAYEAVNGTMVVRPLPDEPHACWNATVVVHEPDGQNRTISMPEDAFDFIQRVQMLPPSEGGASNST